MKIMTFALSTAALLGLTACVTQKPLSSDFGNATQQNLAVQVINPGPNEKPMTYDGTRTADAVDQYHKGTVKQPDEVTTAGSSGGGTSLPAPGAN